MEKHANTYYHDIRKADAFLKANQFLMQLRKYNDKLTWQQYKTLRGQALAGDIEGAYKGLETLLARG